MAAHRGVRERKRTSYEQPPSSSSRSLCLLRPCSSSSPPPGSNSRRGAEERGRAALRRHHLPCCSHPLADADSSLFPSSPRFLFRRPSSAVVLLTLESYPGDRLACFASASTRRVAMKRGKGGNRDAPKHAYVMARVSTVPKLNT